MKFNGSYAQKIDLKNTLEYINYLRDFLIVKLIKKFNFIKVIPPKFLGDDDIINTDKYWASRNISFDLGYSQKIARLIVNYANWSRQLIDKIKLSHNQGIWFESFSIQRDIEENTSTSINEEFISFYVNVNQKESVKEKNNLTYLLYEQIYWAANKIQTKYGLKNNFPQSAPRISSQQMENELPDMNFAQREQEMILNEHAYILTNSGKKLFSGKRHNLLSPEIYDLGATDFIVLQDKINSDPVHVASISVLASGNQLNDQLNIYGSTNLLEVEFFKKMMEKSDKVIEIKINILKLVQVLLQKGHIIEVQAGIITDEAISLEARQDIETF